jgi:ribosome recycling factor
MTEEIQMIFDEAKQGMQSALEHLQDELTKIRAGKSNPSMLASISVDYYGTMTPLSQVANISTPDAKTLTVQPWEKPLLGDINTAIMAANLGFTPQDNGEMLIISLPPLTEERRKQLVKMARAAAEHCKVSIRNVRKDSNDAVKKEQKDGLPEDAAKDAESKIQDVTNTFSAKADTITDAKEKDIMTV